MAPRKQGRKLQKAPLIELTFDEPMKPTQGGPDAPVGVNALVAQGERFIEMYNISTYRDGDLARDIALFNFTALHQGKSTRFKLAFWDRSVGDVRKHQYRIVAKLHFEPGT